MQEQHPTPRATKQEKALPAVAQREKTQPVVKRQTRVEKLPPYNVVLLDDSQHTYQYVMEMLTSIFGYGAERTYAYAREVDRTGRVIVYTTHRELAELKREQILAFGCDPRLTNSRGSMGALIEPAAV
jgi:ATP-dependent Clp protease adaptor protein ClpS